MDPDPYLSFDANVENLTSCWTTIYDSLRHPKSKKLAETLTLLLCRLVRPAIPRVPMIDVLVLRERMLDVTAKVHIQLLVPPVVPPKHVSVVSGWTVKGAPNALLVPYMCR